MSFVADLYSANKDIEVISVDVDKKLIKKQKVRLAKLYKNYFRFYQKLEN